MMPTPDEDIHNTAPEEVKKLMGDAKLDSLSTHEERNHSSGTGSIENDSAPSDAESSEEKNQAVKPDDSEQYAHEDNAEARDSRRPYEDVITPETYDADLESKVKKRPDED